MWLVYSLQLVRFHTLMYLHQPAETTIGFWLLGEKRTQETQSWWPSSWARVFHSWGGDTLCTRHNKRSSLTLMVLSLAAETICLL